MFGVKASFGQLGLGSSPASDSGVDAHPRGHPQGLMLLSPFHSMLSKLQALQAEVVQEEQTLPFLSL